jgi:hypothetical protein
VINTKAKENEPNLINQMEVVQSEEVETSEVVEEDDTRAVRVETEDVGEDIMQMDEVREVFDDDDQSVDEKLSKLTFGELNDEQKQKIHELLRKYVNIFDWNEKRCNATTKLSKHQIDVGNNKPFKQKQYRIPHNLKDEMSKQVESMLEKNVIRKSHSPWNSPVILVKKKNGKFRFCVDFRKLNDITVKDSYPLPFIDETVDSVSGAMYFVTLDFANGYWHIELDEQDKEKTAFTINGQTYEFNVMPFGLTNAPSTFQRMMDDLLRGLTWKKCLVYLDDVIVFARTFEQLLVNLEEVLIRVQAANLKLQPEKCVFGARQVNYLGFELSDKGLSPNPEKVKAIDDIKSPSNTKELKRFLGSTSFYRRFIKNYSEYSSKLSYLTSNKVKFKWTPVEERAFNELKERLKSAPILKFPDFKKNFIVETDASNCSIGCVLLQMFDDVAHPIAYGSRHLSGAEKNYSTSERELLAIVWASRHFRNYIFGRKVLFFSDHKPLATIKKLKDKSNRLAKLFLKLQDLDYEIIYKKGSENVLADFLSRIPEDRAQLSLITKLESQVNWVAEQQKDINLEAIRQLVSDKNNSRHDWELQVDDKRWYKLRKWMIVLGDTLQKIDFGGNLLIIVPEHLKLKIFELYHDRDNHKGSYQKIKEMFFWLDMQTDIEAWSKSCDVCQKTKFSNKHPKAPLEPIVVTQPWQLLGLDHIGPLPVTKNGNRYITLGCDYFTKYGDAKPSKAINAEQSARFVFDNFTCKFGMIEAIITDQSRIFESQVFRELCNLCGIKKMRTTSYHHEGLGMVERLVRTLKEILRCYVNETHSDWDELLSQVVFAYNTTRHNSSLTTPFEAVFGRKPVRFQDILLNIKRNSDFANKSEYLINLKRSNERIQQAINQSLEKSRRYQKNAYDKEVTCYKPFNVGDLVLLSKEAGKVGLAKSLLWKYVGPFVVVERINRVNYKIADTRSRNKCMTVHFNRLKPYRQRSPSQYPVIPCSKSSTEVETPSLTKEVLEEEDSDDESLSFFIYLSHKQSDKTSHQPSESDVVNIDETDSRIVSEAGVADKSSADGEKLASGSNEEKVNREKADEDDPTQDEVFVDTNTTVVEASMQCRYCNKEYTYPKCLQTHEEKCPFKLF